MVKIALWFHMIVFLIKQRCSRSELQNLGERDRLNTDFIMSKDCSYIYIYMHVKVHTHAYAYSTMNRESSILIIYFMLVSSSIPRVKLKMGAN